MRTQQSPQTDTMPSRDTKPASSGVASFTLNFTCEPESYRYAYNTDTEAVNKDCEAIISHATPETYVTGSPSVLRYLLANDSVFGTVRIYGLNCLAAYANTLSVLANNKSIHTLQIARKPDSTLHSIVNPITLLPIIQGLHQNTSIRRLILSDVLLDNSELSILSAYLPSNLIDLDLSHNAFSRSGLHIFTTNLESRAAKLQALNLAGSIISTDGVEECLNLILLSCQQLNHLNLSNCPLSLSTLNRLLSNGTNSITALESLNLANTFDPSIETLDTIYRTLSKSETLSKKIRYLDLDLSQTINFNLPESCIVSIGTIFGNYNRLETLLLPEEFYDIYGTRLHFIVTTLEKNTIITSLQREDATWKLPSAIETILVRNRTIKNTKRRIVEIIEAAEFLNDQATYDELESIEALLRSLTPSLPQGCPTDKVTSAICTLAQEALTIASLSRDLYAMLANEALPENADSMEDILNRLISSFTQFRSTYFDHPNLSPLRPEDVSISVFIARADDAICKHRLNTIFIKQAVLLRQSIESSDYLYNPTEFNTKLNALNNACGGTDPIKITVNVKKMQELGKTLAKLSRPSLDLLASIEKKEYLASLEQNENGEVVQVEDLFTTKYDRLAKEMSDYVKHAEEATSSLDLPDDIVDIWRLGIGLKHLGYGWEVVWPYLSAPFKSPKLQVLAETELGYCMLASFTPLSETHYCYILWLLRHEISQPKVGTNSRMDIQSLLRHLDEERHSNLKQILESIPVNANVTTYQWLNLLGHKYIDHGKTPLTLLARRVVINAMRANYYSDEKILTLLPQIVETNKRITSKDKHSHFASRTFPLMQVPFYDEDNARKLGTALTAFGALKKPLILIDKIIIDYAQSLDEQPDDNESLSIESAIDRLIAEIETTLPKKRTIEDINKRLSRSVKKGRQEPVELGGLRKLFKDPPPRVEDITANSFAKLFKEPPPRVEDITQDTLTKLFAESSPRESTPIVAEESAFETAALAAKSVPIEEDDSSTSSESSDSDSLSDSLGSISENELTELAERIKDNRMSKLDLSKRMICSYELEKLITPLKSNTSLTSIDLSDNCLDDNDIITLIDTLKGKTTIRKLKLSYNTIKKIDISKFPRSIKKLYLNDNAIGKSELFNLIKSLKENTSLEQLYLKDTTINVKHLRALRDSLQTNRTLTHVVLDDYLVRDDTGKRIRSQINTLFERNKQLKSDNKARASEAEPEISTIASPIGSPTQSATPVETTSPVTSIEPNQKKQTTLKLYGIKHDFSAHFNKITSNLSLKHLKLHSCDLYPCNEVFFDALGRNRLPITVLTVKKCFLKEYKVDRANRTTTYDFNVHELFTLLSQNKHLKKVDMSSNWIRLNIKPDQIHYSLNHTLQSLTLAHNSLSSSSLGLDRYQLFFKYLFRCLRALRHLDLSHCHLSPQSLKAINGYIDGSKIKTLCLSGNNFSDSKPSTPTDECYERFLCGIVRKIRHTETLMLGNCKIGNVGLASIAKGLEENTSLKELILDANHFSLEGIKALANALEVNTSLTKLSLRGNALCNEAAAILAKALEKNTTLQVLDLGDNQITYRGTEPFSTALAKNSSLVSLNLSGNEIYYREASRTLGSLDRRLKRNRSLSKAAGKLPVGELHSMPVVDIRPNESGRKTASQATDARPSFFRRFNPRRNTIRRSEALNAQEHDELIARMSRLWFRDRGISI